ncbi:hypothetical protein [Sporomusa malonica]|uniref:hypothetical protein n=1 Tax=Sporomusa malonica TaxID=112901 RepID=UPI000A0306A5|nr:hypothetical protein [Sporomusa malonica]
MNKRWSKLMLSFTLITLLVGAALAPALPVSAASAQQSPAQMTPMMDKDKMMNMMQSPEMKPMMMSMMKDMMMSPEMKPMMMDMMKDMMQSPEMKDMMQNMMKDMMSKHTAETPQQSADHTKHSQQ